MERDYILSGRDGQTILPELCGQKCSRESWSVLGTVMLKASELERNVLDHTVTWLSEDKDWVWF